ncbi:Fc.00g085330.m01.CDS01 [Cosmosporella sp. VM-42]
MQRVDDRHIDDKDYNNHYYTITDLYALLLTPFVLIFRGFYEFLLGILVDFFDYRGIFRRGFIRRTPFYNAQTFVIVFNGVDSPHDNHSFIYAFHRLGVLINIPSVFFSLLLLLLLLLLIQLFYYLYVFLHLYISTFSNDIFAYQFCPIRQPEETVHDHIYLHSPFPRAPNEPGCNHFHNHQYCPQHPRLR